MMTMMMTMTMTMTTMTTTTTDFTVYDKMILALEFYTRSLNLRNNPQIPCSFCLESDLGHRKVVSLNYAYRSKNTIAVRHWNLSDCPVEQALPALSEKIIPISQIYDHDSVVVPNHKIMFYNCPSLASSSNNHDNPTNIQFFSRVYDSIFDFQHSNYLGSHLYYKETWIWREFVRSYLSINYSFDQISKLRQLLYSMSSSSNSKIWYTWLLWKKYLLDFPNTPGEMLYCRQYGSNCFNAFE